MNLWVKFHTAVHSVSTSSTWQEHLQGTERAGAVSMHRKLSSSTHFDKGTVLYISRQVTGFYITCKHRHWLFYSIFSRMSVQHTTLWHGGPFQNTQQVRSLSTLMKMVSSSRAEARYVYCPLWKIWVHKLKVLFCSKTYIPGVSWPGSPAQTLIFWQFYCCNKLSSCDPGVLCLLPLPMRLQQAKHSQLLTSSFGHTK